MRISDWSSDVCSSDLEIVIDGEHCERLDSGDRTRVRREKLGFVYQFHHLLPDFTAAENVLLPQLVRDTDPADAGLSAKQLLAGLCLGPRLDHRPAQLSGGAQLPRALHRAPATPPG